MMETKTTEAVVVQQGGYWGDLAEGAILWGGERAYVVDAIRTADIQTATTHPGHLGYAVGPVGGNWMGVDVRPATSEEEERGRDLSEAFRLVLPGEE